MDPREFNQRNRAVLLAFIVAASLLAMPLAFTGFGDSGTVAAAGGDKEWEYVANSSVGGDRTGLTVDGDTLYAASFGGELYALDRDTGSENWVQSVGADIESTPIVYNELLIVGTSGAGVRAYDKETGDLQWTYDTSGGDFRTSPIIVGDSVYIGSPDDDKLHVIDAETGDGEWTFDLGGSVLGTPASNGNTVFVTTVGGNALAIDATTGEEKWNKSVGTDIWGGPVYYNGTIFFGDGADTGNNIFALDATTGKQEWAFDAENGGQSTPTVWNGTLYIGTEDTGTGDNVRAFNTTTGEQKWTYSTGGNVDSSPTVASGTVYVGSNDDKLHAIDANDGTQEWTFTTGPDGENSNVRSSPTVATGTVYVGSDTGYLYALDTGHGESSQGERVQQGILGYNSYVTEWRSPSEKVTGQVTDQSGDPINQSTVSFTDQSDETTTVETGPNGNFEAYVGNGTYELEISHPRYQTYRDVLDITEGDDLGTFELEPSRLELDFRNRMDPDTSQEYRVYWTDQDGETHDVTGSDNLTISSSNASIATVNRDAAEIVAADGVNASINISANYTAGGETFETTKPLTVAVVDVEHLEILPGAWRFSALMGDVTIQVLLIAIGAGIVGTRAAGAFAGIGMLQMTVTLGWFGGYIPDGIALVSVFTALFVGLNLAANIDYTVAR